MPGTNQQHRLFSSKRYARLCVLPFLGWVVCAVMLSVTRISKGEPDIVWICLCLPFVAAIVTLKVIDGYHRPNSSTNNS